MESVLRNCVRFRYRSEQNQDDKRNSNFNWYGEGVTIVTVLGSRLTFVIKLKLTRSSCVYWVNSLRKTGISNQQGDSSWLATYEERDPGATVINDVTERSFFSPFTSFYYLSLPNCRSVIQQTSVFNSKLISMSSWRKEILKWPENTFHIYSF